MLVLSFAGCPLGEACTCDRSGALARPLLWCTCLFWLYVVSDLLVTMCPCRRRPARVSMHLLHRTFFSLYYTILRIRHANVAWEPLYMFRNQRTPVVFCASLDSLPILLTPSPRDGASAGFLFCVLFAPAKGYGCASVHSGFGRAPPPTALMFLVRGPCPFLLLLLQLIIANGVCLQWTAEGWRGCYSCLPLPLLVSDFHRSCTLTLDSPYNRRARTRLSCAS